MAASTTVVITADQGAGAVVKFRVVVTGVVPHIPGCPEQF
jgi:hypothetical protein